jgi:hypothetical protein
MRAFAQKPGTAHITPKLQRTIGNQALPRSLQSKTDEPNASISGGPRKAGPLQTRLVVNKLADEYERNADVVAEQVMRMPKTSGKVQKRIEVPYVHERDAKAAFAPPAVGDIRLSAGEPLDPTARAFLEPRFGHDFSQVRVHADRSAAESAQALGALAFTVGSHIAFNSGQYDPHGCEGRRLLAHELTHVLQQRSSGVDGLVQRQLPQATAPPATAATPANRSSQPYQHAWENPALLATIYPAREAMLRRFVAIYHEIELEALPEDQRGAVIERVQREIQSELTRLEALPAPTRAHRARIDELRGILRRGMIRAQRAWAAAVSWERAHHGQSLQGEQLLAEVRRLFQTRHVPEWLRPMVLDYAGMRYRSAHGSYYSPVRLLYLIEDARGTYARERSARVAATPAPPGGQRRRSPSPTTTETATLALDPADAAQRLVGMHEAGEIPDWVWRQIVRDTDLRVQYAGPDWETSSRPPAGGTPEADAFWQGVLRRWRGGETIGRTGVGSTGWRAELYRRNALVTTRMVCNELAEAAARQRGIRLPGGIRGDSDYYVRQAELAVQPNAPPPIAGAYFRNPRGPEDFVPGAGLFFVKGIWQTTEPGPHAKVIAVAGLTYPNIMTAEESAVQVRYETERRRWRGQPEATRGEAPVNPYAGRSETLPADGQVVDGWTYHVTPGQAIHRTRGAETQWMAWSHEATVIHRIENRVFTLETTDAGGGAQTESGHTGGASGFRTRDVSDLLRPGVFVGYIPGNERPAAPPARSPAPAAPPTTPGAATGPTTESPPTHEPTDAEAPDVGHQ